MDKNRELDLQVREVPVLKLVHQHTETCRGWACPLTLRVWSGRDFHGVGQRTGDQPLTVEDHHGFGLERAEDTLQPIRIPQSGVGGDEDVNLRKGEREGWAEFNGGGAPLAAVRQRNHLCY